MGDSIGKIGARCIVEAVVTRADGTVENLGVIADSQQDQVEADDTILGKIKGILRGKLLNG